ncbi:hypothetical protein ABT404_33635 [Streptomyces hyaluromycini]|uniref:DUF11 domain-containing protein n=1 Tax=Streptomyces hyaluromycini TaxID=1377993 RepID=A0ABV1X5P8_9ACTN
MPDTDGTGGVVMRRGGLAVVGAVAVGALVVGGGGTAWAGSADLEVHGSAVLSGDLVEVRVVPLNHGPDGVTAASVRLSSSAALADTQQLPGGCARTGDREVVCDTGPLAVELPGAELVVPVRLRDQPAEVRLEVDVAWGGGAVDQDRTNDRQRVLVLATGDSYAF